MRLLAAVALAAAACGDGSSSEPDASTADAGPWIQNGPCAVNTRAGDLHVDQISGVVSGAFSGEVREGLDLADLLTPREQEGACQLFRRDRPTCPDPCPGETTCDGTMCVPKYRTRSAGTITVTGGVEDFSAEPDPVNQSYSNTLLPNPPFAPGDRLTLVAEGDEVAGFTLRATGVPTLTVPAEVWTVIPGQPFTVTWDALGSADSSMLLVLNVDQHGNTPVQMMCEVPDTGSYTIPGTLVQTWVDYGVTGFPNISFVRRSSDSIIRGDWCIEFEARSAVPNKQLAVEGHIPCNVANPCPSPLVCDFVLETCVSP